MEPKETDIPVKTLAIYPVVEPGEENDEFADTIGYAFRVDEKFITTIREDWLDFRDAAMQEVFDALGIKVEWRHNVPDGGTFECDGVKIYVP